MKVAVVTPIPTPYRDGFWQEVSSRPEIQLDVLYCSPGKADRPWQATWDRDFSWEVLPGRNLASWRGLDASCYWNPLVTQRLRDGHYDAIVIGGYNHLTMLAAIRYAQKRGIPYFMMCESYGRQRTSAWRRLVKRLQVVPLMKKAAGTFPTGTLAARYVVQLGADPQRVTRLPNVPDVERLYSESEDLRAAAEARIADQRDGRHVFLFAGRLIPKKRGDLLIRAFHRAEVRSIARLVIVGDGPERPALEQLCRELGLTNDVEFAGFRQPDEMVKWYASACIFIMPSSETWGVSVIEALSCRTPVIVSDEVGCHPDAIGDARIGRVVAAGDEEQLVAALKNFELLARSAVEDDQAWAALRSRFAYEHLAETFCGAIEGVIRSSGAA